MTKLTPHEDFILTPAAAIEDFLAQARRDAGLPPLPAKRTITSAEFAAGQVIQFYGAFYRLRDDVKGHVRPEMHSYNVQRVVYTATGDKVGGVDDMPAEWRFQGNDLARWTLEGGEG